MHHLNSSYWQNRYEQNQTGWDAGEITTPLKEYFDQLKDKNIRILIPGAGNAYEAEYLHRRGFNNVFVIDIATAPLQNIINRYPDFPKNHLIHGDFFEHSDQYDLIVEQTFFCALDPSLRRNYAEKMAALLPQGGKLAGLLFDRDFEGGPPFGGCAAEYKEYFEKLFRFKVFETSLNSIPPRQGTELFMILEKL
jgi:methyl halide transferase